MRHIDTHLGSLDTPDLLIHGANAQIIKFDAAILNKTLVCVSLRMPSVLPDRPDVPRRWRGRLVHFRYAFRKEY